MHVAPKYEKHILIENSSTKDSNLNCLSFHFSFNVFFNTFSGCLWNAARAAMHKFFFLQRVDSSWSCWPIFTNAPPTNNFVWKGWKIVEVVDQQFHRHPNKYFLHKDTFVLWCIKRPPEQTTSHFYVYLLLQNEVNEHRSTDDLLAENVLSLGHQSGASVWCYWSLTHWQTVNLFIVLS